MRKRIWFEKNRPMMFTSSLDLLSIWQRSLKRADLQIVYSKGFHPLPKIQLAVPLPLGFIGKNEIVDIWFEKDYSNRYVSNRLSDSVPVGIKIISVEDVIDPQGSLLSRSVFADYSIEIFLKKVTLDKLTFIIDEILSRPSIIRERNNKHYDLRPLIVSMACKKDEHNLKIHMRLLAKPSSTGRPDEVLKEMGLGLENCAIERTRILFTE